MKQRLLFALISASLISLSFPPLKVGFLAYGALVPFLFLLNGLTVKEAFKWGYLVGLLISIGTIYWIFLPTPAGGVAAILFHPVYFALFALSYVFLQKYLNDAALIAVPFLWTAMEYLKSLGELGFPWVSLGYTQSYYTSLIQYASVTSVYGVSFWVVLLNICIYKIFQRRDNNRAVIIYTTIFIFLILIPFVYGRLVIPRELPKAKTVRTALIQGNIDPYLKWDKKLREMNFATYERLSRKVGRGKVDIVIWPETATPTYLLHDRRNLARVQSLFRELDTPILTGTPDYIRLSNNQYETFNSVALIDAVSGPYQKYAKIHLVPFGERVPYEDAIPLIKKLLSSLEMGEGNFSPGRERTLFHLIKRLPDSTATDNFDIPFATVICFESIFPDLVSQFVRKGAQFLVVITNDGWFGRTGAPFQHARMSIFRAIENRISIARCANTGVSMTIDPYGRVRKQTAIFKEAVIIDQLPLRREITFFTRSGNIFTKAVFVIAIALIIGTALEKRFRK